MNSPIERKDIPFIVILILVSTNFSSKASIVSSHFYPLDASYLHLNQKARIDTIPPHTQVWGMITGRGSRESSYDGAIFRYDLTDLEYQDEFRFQALSEGADPVGNLAADHSGILYGVTYSGGNNNEGLLYSFDPKEEGIYRVLYHFDSLTGSLPFGTLLIEGDKIYGLTRRNNQFSGGVLYEFNLSTLDYQVLHDFGHYIGDDVTNNGSVISYNGSLYGMTVGGGIYDEGVIYQFDLTSLEYNILHHFDPQIGSQPSGGLLQIGEKLYGITGNGDPELDGFGILFEYDLSADNQPFQVIENFDAFSFFESGSLIESNNFIYGSGRSSGYGNEILFKYDILLDSLHELHEFNFNDGRRPTGKLVFLDNSIYGLTTFGGANGSGVIFKYDLAGNGTYEVIHNLDQASGGFPMGHLTVSDNKLYAVSHSGGNSGFGVIFEYDLEENKGFQLRHHFKETLGNNPGEKLILVNGKFYGVTRHGGKSGQGILFEFDPTGPGIFIVLHDFRKGDGEAASCGLTYHNDKLYGVTNRGGKNSSVSGNLGNGVLFEFDLLEKEYSVLHYFDTTSGIWPGKDLLIRNNRIYGMTKRIGQINGVLYEYDLSSDSYSVKHDFGPSTLLNRDLGGLIAKGNKLYGMNPNHEPSGAIFEFDLEGSGTYTILHKFSTGEGYAPHGSLMLLENKLYGLNSHTIFEYDIAVDTLKVLHLFESSTGHKPEGSLIALGDQLFGLASRGGNDYSGVIFNYDLSNHSYTVLHHFDDPTTSYLGNAYAWGTLLAVKGCEDILNLDNEILAGEHGDVFSTSELISSSGTITLGEGIEFMSFHTILTNGFEVEIGAEFKIHNEPCFPKPHVNK